MGNKFRIVFRTLALLGALFIGGIASHIVVNAEERLGYAQGGQGYSASSSESGIESESVAPMIEGFNWARAERFVKQTVQPVGWRQIYGLELTSAVEAGPVLAQFCFRAVNTDPNTGPVTLGAGIFLQGAWKGLRTLTVHGEDLGCFSWTGTVAAGIASGSVWANCLSCASAWIELDFMSITAWQ